MHHHIRGCLCGTGGPFSKYPETPQELPRAERTASVCVLVPSKQGNLENTKGAANKHNLIPPSSYTWRWILQWGCLSACVCIYMYVWERESVYVCDAMPRWLDQEGCYGAFASVHVIECVCVIREHEKMCNMRVQSFIILQWEACQCCWEMAGLCPITPWRLCLYGQSCAKMSALDTWHRNGALLYTKVCEYRAVRHWISPTWMPVTMA